MKDGNIMLLIVMVGFFIGAYIANHNVPQFWNLYDGGFKEGKTYIGVRTGDPFISDTVAMEVLEKRGRWLKVRYNGKITTLRAMSRITVYRDWTEKKD